MEAIVNGIVIRSIDYKDNDKLLTLFTLEKGKISAVVKGVKKSGAKLKFASEPFSFCEFVLAEKGGRNTVIGATYLDSFYNLRLDMLKYYVSAVVSETLNLFTAENEVDAQLFKLAINAVKQINYGGGELKTLAGYLLNLIEILGYKIYEYDCACCGEEITGRVFFKVKDAEFCCASCRAEDFMEITLETYKALKLMDGKTPEEASNIDLEKSAEIKLLKFIFYYLLSKTETRIKSGVSLIEFLSNS